MNTRKVKVSDVMACFDLTLLIFMDQVLRHDYEWTNDGNKRWLSKLISHLSLIS